MSAMQDVPAVQTEADVERLLTKIPVLRQEIGKAVIGQQRVVEELLTAFLAGGHCLIEGLPGLGKTLLIRTLAQAVHVRFVVAEPASTTFCPAMQVVCPTHAVAASPS